MKTRTLLMSLTCALAASAGACSVDTKPVVDEPTASTDSKIITATNNIMIWPTGTIGWNGLVGTMPLSIWAPAGCGAVAFDVAGLTGLGLSVVGFPALNAVTISTPYLNAFGFGLAPVAGPVAAAPLLGAGGVVAPAYGFAGAFNPVAANGFGFSAFAPTAGLAQATVLNGAITPGLASWATPTLTSSALMLTNLAATTAFTPFAFNLTFTAQSAAQAASIANMASLSVFATPIGPDALTATIPFTSMAFPVFAPLGGLGAVAPLAGAVAPLAPLAGAVAPLGAVPVGGAVAPVAAAGAVAPAVVAAPAAAF